MLRSASRKTKDVVCAGLATMTNTAAGRPHLCAQPAIAAVRSQSRALRCSVVAGPGRFSARCFSTEPVLQNAANPEMPAAPIQKPAPDNPDGSVVVSEKVERLCNDILSLNMLELNQLLKVLKARLGLTDADLRGAVVASPGAGAPAEAAAEEKAPAKDTFDLKLVGFDEKSKIKVIKEVRGISGLGLKEAKELVEGVPKVIKKGLKKDEAEKLAEKLKEAGAKVELD